MHQQTCRYRRNLEFFCPAIPWLCVFVLASSIILSMGCAGESIKTRNSVKVLPARPGEQVCLSLRNLARAAGKRFLRKEAQKSCGMSWIEGYVVDSDNADIILVGKCLPQRPLIMPDDLVVHLRNVWGEDRCPECSLDPRNEDVVNLNHLFREDERIAGIEDMRSFFQRLKKVWGPQVVYVGGVPRNSRLAHVMIDADYHMKKLSQGHVEAAGITSCLDRVIEEAKRSWKPGQPVPASRVSMSRFWFHVGKDEPNFLEDEGIVWIDRCSVIVLTEKQMATTDGRLIDSGGDDPHAQAFARELSSQFEKLATQVPEYADLWNQYRLYALLLAMHYRDAPSRAPLDLSFFLERFEFQLESEMPASLPGLTNSKELQESFTEGKYSYKRILFPMACGGVSMEVQIKPEMFHQDHTGKLQLQRAAIVKSRPGKDVLYWPLSKDLIQALRRISESS